ncbi:MAG: hypothetical protein GY818_06020, partial [Planctomycetaceae bacterium]|nr:hypothetical protein [Planctomycetaceae bacterium]
MKTTAVGLADLLRGVIDSSREEQITPLLNEIISSEQQRFEVFDFRGNRLHTIASKNFRNDDAIETLPELKYLLDETKAGRTGKTSWYNVNTNSRLLVIAVPFGPLSNPLGALCLSMDTHETDHILSGSFKKLLIGFVSVGLFALFVGWLIALWVAKPARDLARAIKRVVNGDGTEPIPRPEVAELATIAEATSIL